MLEVLSGATSNVRAMRYVAYRDITTYLAMGWFAPEPATFARLNYYGIEMLWLCDCKSPDQVQPQAAGVV